MQNFPYSIINSKNHATIIQILFDVYYDKKELIGLYILNVKLMHLYFY